MSLRTLIDETIGKSWRDAVTSTPSNKWLPGSAGPSPWLADQKQKILNQHSANLAPAHGYAPVVSSPSPWSPSDLLPDDWSAKSLTDDDSTAKARWMWSVYMGNGQHGGSGAGSASPGFDYLDAPWASAYGMSPETAYNEAMENTAYRRSVTDMKAAGLNPAAIFGAGKGSTAGSPGYISLASSGGSGGSGRGYGRRSGSRSSGDKLFSSSAYSVLSSLGGILGAAATKSAGGYWIGTSLTQGAMNALNALSKWNK